jgi:hypothetical protein
MLSERGSYEPSIDSVHSYQERRKCDHELLCHHSGSRFVAERGMYCSS